MPPYRFLLRFLLPAAALVVACLLVAVPTFAQTATVVGVVLDENRDPIDGAGVVLVGTDIGDLTNLRGEFSFTAEPGTYQIQVNRIGFRSAVRSVALGPGELLSVEFVLSPRAVPLEDLVATVAAVEQRRIETGTDIERLSVAAALELASQETLSDLVGARAPGVIITKPSGDPGTASQIRVRAATSLTQTNTPLIYVDGVRTSNNTEGGPSNPFSVQGQTISRFDDLSPEDVATIQVIKGPTATALYGAQAAAGVLLVETKRGRDGTRYTVTTEQGVSYDPNQYEDLYINLTTNAGVSDVNDPVFQQWRPVQNPVTGDIFGRHNPLMNSRTRPFRVARVSRFYLNASGSGDGADYFLSGSYDNIQGTLPVQGVERFSGRVNFTFRPVEALEFLVSSSYINRDTDLAVGNRDAFGWITNGIVGIPFFSFGTLPDGRRGDCMATIIAGLPESVCALQEGNFFTNFDNLARVTQAQRANRVVASVEALHRPTDWLSQRLVIGTDRADSKDQNVVPSDPAAFPGRGAGFVNDFRTSDGIVTVDYAATASFNIGDRLSGSTTAGGQFFSARRDRVGCAGEGLASPTAIACDATLTFQGFSDLAETKEVGGFFQQTFGLNEYLFVRGAVRVDDISSLGVEEGLIVSPSANASWVVSRMPFWQGGPLSDLRFRFAWGRAAQAPDPFVADEAFQTTRRELDGNSVLGLTTLRPGNPELRAERSEEFEGGLDGALFEDRVTFKLTFYSQRVTDAILRAEAPPSSGFSAPRFVNIGAVSNKGFEGALGALLLNREAVSWNLDFSISTNNPIITDIGDQPPVFNCFVPGRGDAGLFVEGLAPGTACGVVVESAERDEEGNIIPESIRFAPGNVEGGPPNLRVLGRQEPSNQQTLSTTVRLLRNFNLYALFERRGGFVKFDQNRHFLNPLVENFIEQRLFSFRQSETSPEMQAMLELGRGQALESIAAITTKADFIRWRDLSVTYELPGSLLSIVDASRGAFTVGVRNVKLWTGYEGIDPELRVVGGADFFSSVDFASQGIARTLTARLSLTF